MEELYPELKHAFWKQRHVAILNLAATPGMVGHHRPGMRPPSVANFYLVSDTVKEARSLGSQAVAMVVLKCADLILQKA